MTASIKVLTTSTIDSSPSILLISPNGSRILINCGEGCQRSFLESPTDRIRSVNTICLTHIGHSATGGLPGFILTSADAAEASYKADHVRNTVTEVSTMSTDDSMEGELKKRSQFKKSRKLDYDNNNNDQKCPNDEIIGNLQIIGPLGTQKFIHSLRYFMRRDKFQLNIREGHFTSKAKAGDGIGNTKKSKKRKKADDEKSNNQDQNQSRKGIFGIQSIPLKQKIDTLTGQVEEVNISSFIFTTSPIPGKFQIEKARRLQIPPGPMYAQLKAGKSVSFPHPTLLGEELTVEPSEVLEGGSDGIAFVLIYCPDEFVLDQICNEEASIEDDMSDDLPKGIALLNKFQVSQNKDCIKLEVMMHYTPKHLFESEKYQSWIRKFDENVQHITIYPAEDLSFESWNERVDGSPFRSAVYGAMTRSLIQREIYTAPFSTSITDYEMISKNEDAFRNNILNGDHRTNLKIIRATSQMEYIIIPLQKKGFINNNSKTEGSSSYGVSQEAITEIVSDAEKSGALRLANCILRSTSDENQIPNKSSRRGELIFTGTGSAIPCKHRNVTGMYLEMGNGNGMLLDVGEGTVGQLIRSWKSTVPSNDNYDDKLLSCKAVWISHPHADHHLGLIRFLTERNKLLMSSRQNGFSNINEDDRVIIMASTSLLKFLSEYSLVDRTIANGYISVDCKDTLLNETNPIQDRLKQCLGITQCISVPVAHCFHSYALVLDGTSFGRLVYSGDCRPSDRLIEIGFGANLLIHEATFEDGMEAEAVLKRHSTVGEAISVAKRMNARNLILSHFSQRYPRIPPLQNEEDSDKISIIVAFDFMRVNECNLALASQLTPALRLLYPDSEESNESLDIDPLEPSAHEILSVPGAFAEARLCN